MAIAVRLTNRYATFLPPADPGRLRGYFQFQIDNHWFHPLVRDGRWDGFISLMRGSRVASGLFLLRAKEIAAKFGLQVEDLREKPEFSSTDVVLPGVETRAFQDQCVKRMIARSHCGGIILNATASGKTTIAAKYFKALKGSAVFVVDERTLLYQARDEFARILQEDVGVVGDSVFEPRRISVATVQTLHLHSNNPAFRKWHRDLDVMIIDELHLALNRRQQETIKQIQPKAVFGLTATLNLKKQSVFLEAVALCGPILFEYPYEVGMQEGVLAPGVVVGVDVVRTQPTKGISWSDLYDLDISRSKWRNKVIIDLVLEGVKRGYSIVVLVERVKHLQAISEALGKLPHRLVWGEKKVKDRRKAVRKLEEGKIQVIIANRVFKKGINIKRVTAIIDAAGGADENDAQQKFGRGARTAPGKEGFLYFDIGDRAPNIKRAKNRFQDATKTRRLALAALKVPIQPIRAREGAAAAWDLGERMLQGLVTSLRQKASGHKLVGSTTEVLPVTATSETKG